MSKYFIPLIVIALSCFSIQAQPKKFVKVKDQSFILKKQDYRFMGANFWQGMYLGMAAPHGDRERLIRELDRMQALGITNLRVLGSSEGTGELQIKPTLMSAPGEYNEAVFEGLDYLLDEMKKRDMKAVVVLNNFWMWSGGFPQYVSWSNDSEVPLPDVLNGGSWDEFISYSLSFFENKQAQQLFRDHLITFLNRKNSINGKKYIKDPTIMAWQLCNEPRGYGNKEGYLKWIDETASLIQSIDKNHMVCLGAEGNTGYRVGIDLYEDNLSPAIDYATTHIWIQNWNWYNPENPASFEEAMDASRTYLSGQLEKAARLGKPVVLEEFGVSRDQGSFDTSASIDFRNKFYQFIFEFVSNNLHQNGAIRGCNFWAWSGEGRPGNPGGLWQQGHDLTGDPPHERQGWYSVYETDEETLELIKRYAGLIKEGAFTNDALSVK